MNLTAEAGPGERDREDEVHVPQQQGIWLHDTPEKEKIEDAARLESNGCVRLEDAPRFARWLFYEASARPKGGGLSRRSICRRRCRCTSLI